MSVGIIRLDHLVLTVANLERSISFYQRVLGLEAVSFGEGRHALRFGDSKINLHLAGAEVEPHALRPQSGSADLCFLVERPVDEVLEGLAELGVGAEVGPVRRTGARTPLLSIYLRDPDGNLIELSNELDQEVSGG